MTQNAFDRKRVNKVTLPKKPSPAKNSSASTSFITPRNLNGANTLSNLNPLPSLYEEHKEVIKHLILNERKDSFMTRVVLFIVQLENSEQIEELLEAVKSVNPEIISKGFDFFTKPIKLKAFVDSASFPVFLDLIEKDVLDKFNNTLEETLLLGSLEENQHNFIVDVYLEAAEKLIQYDKVNEKLLSTLVLAEYDLGYSHDKAYEMFSELLDFRTQEALNLM